MQQNPPSHTLLQSRGNAKAAHGEKLPRFPGPELGVSARVVDARRSGFAAPRASAAEVVPSGAVARRAALPVSQAWHVFALVVSAGEDRGAEDSGEGEGFETGARLARGDEDA
ncbi:MAG: hypothetical protein Q9191_008530 [Dirinaria sp. TL-2023a]